MANNNTAKKTLIETQANLVLDRRNETDPEVVALLNSSIFTISAMIVDLPLDFGPDAMRRPAEGSTGIDSETCRVEGMLLARAEVAQRF